MRSLPFVKSKGIFRIIKLSRDYKKTPSEIMNIEDEYTAFCLNEACNEIEEMLRDKDCPPPRFVVKYASFTDLYRQYES